jgi:hypothetical protein
MCLKMPARTTQIVSISSVAPFDLASNLILRAVPISFANALSFELVFVEMVSCIVVVFPH